MSDISLFTYHHEYLLFYIDEIVLTTSRPKLLQHITTTLQLEFIMKDLDPLHLLSVSTEQRHNNIFLHQHWYTLIPLNVLA
jgi:hypothetical protein